MDRAQGKVALVTGAVRGQRRAEAVELAEEDADLIDVNLTGGVQYDARPNSGHDRARQRQVDHCQQLGSGRQIPTGTSALLGRQTWRRRSDEIRAKSSSLHTETRVNSVHPWGVDTDMTLGPAAKRYSPTITPILRRRVSISSTRPSLRAGGYGQCRLFQASDDARTMTGCQLSPDHGATKI
jgi:NAD(P)-dependent dehydrogenase (short-subunit alcohol dehydrogenase family)